jgi:tetratricopeptide (TPR) repeat protein
MTQDLVRQAAELAKAGQKDEARKILRDVLQQDLDNLQAWAGLATLAESKQEATLYLQEMLEIEPGNEWAGKRMAELESIPRKRQPRQDSRQLTIGVLFTIAFVLLLCVAVTVQSNTSRATVTIDPAYCADFGKQTVGAIPELRTGAPSYYVEIPCGTTLKVLRVRNLPGTEVPWYKVRYLGATAWVGPAVVIVNEN